MATSHDSDSLILIPSTSTPTSSNSGLFTWKRDLLLFDDQDQKLFGTFHTWVFERWRYSQPGPQNYSKRGRIVQQELGEFLNRKAWQGKFVLRRQPGGEGLEGRLRLLVTMRPNADDASALLGLQKSDFILIEERFGLHPSTIQYVRRNMVTSKIWREHGTNMSFMMCFPSTPPPRYDFISLSHNLQSKTTTALLRDTGVHPTEGIGGVVDLTTILEGYNSSNAHPLLVLVILLDLFLIELEPGILQNSSTTASLEFKVSAISSMEGGNGPMSEREDVTGTLTDLHTCLKTAIKFLDAIRWAHRTARLLLEAGEELKEAIANEDKPDSQLKSDWGTLKTANFTSDWATLREYLDDATYLMANLEPDPVMTQQRCQSQIDILNSKMAQEDNLLAAQLAVSTTRDSSAMKALAVITALFLPGSYIATLFSMSMFNWQAGMNSNSVSTNSTDSATSQTSLTVMPNIWIYWLITAILTLLVIFGWRLWYLKQDHDFKKRLPKAVQASKGGLIKKRSPTTRFVEGYLTKEGWKEAFKMKELRQDLGRSHQDPKVPSRSDRRSNLYRV